MIIPYHNIEKLPCIASVCISSGGIPKLPQLSVRVHFNGLEGDGHNHEKHNNPLQAVCLMDWEILEALHREGFKLAVGTIGENLTVCSLNVQKLSVGTVLEFFGGVVLELTKERKPCYVLDSIHPRLKEAIIGRCGFYAKVLREGVLRVGEPVEVTRLAAQAGENLCGIKRYKK